MGRIDLNYVLLTHFDFNEGPFFLTISCEVDPPNRISKCIHIQKINYFLNRGFSMALGNIILSIVFNYKRLVIVFNFLEANVNIRALKKCFDELKTCGS